MIAKRAIRRTSLSSQTGVVGGLPDAVGWRRLKLVRYFVILTVVAAGAAITIQIALEYATISEKTSLALEVTRDLSHEGSSSLSASKGPVIPSATDKPMPASYSTIAPLEDKERTIHLVHVGKSGGETIREETAILCNNFKHKEACINRRFNSSQKLARQTKHAFHLWALREEQIQNATSFLVTLRNPVDRIISTYRYSHPENCHTRQEIHKPHGCRLIEKHWKGGKSVMSPFARKVYQECFPSPLAEEFAQNVASPWVTTSSDHFQNNLTLAQQKECRKVAQTLVQGGENYGAAPHMEYNYAYYFSKAIEAFPGKEIFVIRTEHEWDDIVSLDRMLGGSGVFANMGKVVSHGSEKFHPSPLSNQAYQKLCCVLEHEIEVYLDILHRALNLDDAAKIRTENDLRQKCQIDIWQKWRHSCQKRIEADNQYLQS